MVRRARGVINFRIFYLLVSFVFVFVFFFRRVELWPALLECVRTSFVVVLARGDLWRAWVEVVRGPKESMRVFRRRTWPSATDGREARGSSHFGAEHVANELTGVGHGVRCRFSVHQVPAFHCARVLCEIRRLCRPRRPDLKVCPSKLPAFWGYRKMCRTFT